MFSGRSRAVHGGIFLTFGLVFMGCAEADSEVSPDAFSGVEAADASPAGLGYDSSGCLCIPGQTIACNCVGGAKGIQTCSANCRSLTACNCASAIEITTDAATDSRVPDSATDASRTGTRDSGSTGTHTDGSTDGSSRDSSIHGGGAADSSTVPTPVACLPTGLAHDACPGKQIELSASGNGQRTGSATGDTSILCPDDFGTCAASTANDAVYMISPDIDGKMTVSLGGASGTSYDAVLYVRATCSVPATELACQDSSDHGSESVTFNVVKNQNYYVFLDGYYDNVGKYRVDVSLQPSVCGNGIVEGSEACDDKNTVEGDGCSSTCVAEPMPAYDACPGVAITLVGSGNDPRTASYAGTTMNLNSDYTGTSYCSSGEGRDAVFAVEPDVNGTLAVNLGGQNATDFDAALYARTTCTLDSSQVACDQDYGRGVETLSFPVIAHTKYYIIIDGNKSTTDSNRGPFRLNVSLNPAFCGNNATEGGEDCDDGNVTDGDGCAHDCKIEPPGPSDVCPGIAVPLAQAGNLLMGTFAGSTTYLSADYSSSCGSSSAKDAVIHFDSGPLGGRATVSLSKSTTNFDAVLFVKKGTCLGSEEVGCKQVYGSGGEVLTFDTMPNTTYWIFVAGYSGASGKYGVEISVAPPVCGDGVLEGIEDCDDSNTADNDGCSSACKWEGSCGSLVETEPNASLSPNVIDPVCTSFTITGTSLTPAPDGDHFLLTLKGGAMLSASTYVGQPGRCTGSANTVLSLWKSPMPVGRADVGGCTTQNGYLACNDDDAKITPCSALTYTVPSSGGGEYILKVHGWAGNVPIPNYGVRVIVK